MNSVVAPRVTVLMPVYNAEHYLREAVDSILGQTLADFEFLIINDGSTDGSGAILATFLDPRIRLLHNPGNLGLVATLNRGIELARGEYIARMDADDISLPDRLARQVNFMESNLAVGVCGTWMEVFSGNESTVWKTPLTHEDICCALFFESVLYHPTVIMRKSLLDRLGFRYDSSFPHAEDYELWSRFSCQCIMANLGEVLVRYRAHEGNVGRRHAAEKIASADKVRSGQLKRLIADATAEDEAIHSALALWQTTPGFIPRVHTWLLRVRAANSCQQLFPEPAFTRALAAHWKYLCTRATAQGVSIYRTFSESPLAPFVGMLWREKLAFIAKSLLRMN